jgi:hypothetical protein
MHARATRIVMVETVVPTAAADIAVSTMAPAPARIHAMHKVHVAHQIAVAVNVVGMDVVVPVAHVRVARHVIYSINALHNVIVT